MVFDDIPHAKVTATEPPASKLLAWTVEDDAKLDNVSTNFFLRLFPSLDLISVFVIQLTLEIRMLFERTSHIDVRRPARASFARLVITALYQTKKYFEKKNVDTNLLNSLYTNIFQLKSIKKSF